MRRIPEAAALMFLAATTSPRLQAPAFQLPKPTGSHPAGTTSWHLTDKTRQETFTGSGPREIDVLAWYPAAAGGTPAPYLREGAIEARSFAKVVRGVETAYDGLADVATHARLDAPIAASPRRLPLLLFSHGYTGLASASTALLEDLASHGYVVISIVHPYEAVAATLTDGRTVTMLDETGAPRQPIRDVFAEWGPEDATMAKVTGAGDDEERRRLLRGYLSTIPKTEAVLRRWVDDTKFVLDWLTPGPLARTTAKGNTGGDLSSDAPLSSFLRDRMDLSRVGVFGHSMGGVTAGQFCAEDRRCRAALNLDGIPQYGTMIDKPFGRPFLMVYSARPGRKGASDAIYRRAAAPYYRVDVADTLHLDFSDMNFWGGPLKERGAFGALPPERAAAITRIIVREFFDQELLKKRSALLSGKTTLPEVTVSRPR